MAGSSKELLDNDEGMYKNIIKLAFPSGLFQKEPAEIQATELIHALQYARTQCANNNLLLLIKWARGK